MKLRTIVMSLAVVTMLFASCEDSKKKEAEAQAQAEQMRMEREKDSLMKVEEVAFGVKPSAFTKYRLLILRAFVEII